MEAAFREHGYEREEEGGEETTRAVTTEKDRSWLVAGDGGQGGNLVSSAGRRLLSCDERLELQRKAERELQAQRHERQQQEQARMEKQRKAEEAQKAERLEHERKEKAHIEEQRKAEGEGRQARASFPARTLGERVFGGGGGDGDVAAMLGFGKPSVWESKQQAFAKKMLQDLVCL